MKYVLTFLALLNVSTLCLFAELRSETLSPTAAAVPSLRINDYTSVVDFTDKKVVLIQKGDNLAYKYSGYDDSGWKVVSLPSAWYTSFPGWSRICWYRLYIEFPPNLPKNALGVSLGIINNVDEVYFNGQLIGSTGKFPPAKDYAYDKIRIYELPTEMIKPGEKNILAIRVSGFLPKESGPNRGVFRIAPLQELQKSLLLKDFVDVLFVMVYLAVSSYFIIIFILKPVSKEYLFFSLFTLSSAFYLFLRTQFKYYLVDNFLLLKRLEYSVLFLVLFFLMEYITYYFKQKNSFIHYIYLGITLLSLVPILIFNDISVWVSVLFYVIEPLWLMPIVFCFYVSIKEFKNRANSLYLVVTFSILTALFINDVLVDRGMYHFHRLSNYGFIFIIIGSAVIMRRRFVELHTTFENLQLKKIKAQASITDETKVKLDNAISYLNENYTSNISREGLAESLAMNPDYFGKQFKQYTGLSINDYINRLRIDRAKELLISGNQTVTDIAFSVGFESLSTFYRVFSEILDETPAGFKEKHKCK